MNYNYDNSWNRMQNFRSRSCDSQNAEEYLRTFHCILDRMIEGMTTAGLTNSISHNFIVQMIPHHRAAIEMSENILRFTNNCTIEEIATNIINEQTKSIADMEAALPCCSSMINSRQNLCNYQAQIEPVFRTMFCRMQNAKTSDNVNCCFLWDMLPHHEGAVSFSEITLCYDICPQLQPILKAIITSQKRGICQMEQLLNTLQC